MKTYIYLFFVLSLFGCQTNKDKCFDSNIFLSEFTKGISKELPPANPNIFFFLKSEGDNIIMLKKNGLYNLYKGNYINSYSFNEFICSLYQEKLSVKETYLIQKNCKYQIFKLDKNIDNLNIELLKNKFCTEKNNKLLLSNNLKESTRFTILYIFFKNKYYISFDDYSGYFFINERLK